MVSLLNGQWMPRQRIRKPPAARTIRRCLLMVQMRHGKAPKKCVLTARLARPAERDADISIQSTDLTPLL
ncbi:MAG: hypothetical protein R3215_15100 [Halomonas sp.]|nr:hypothetical protein [Halomonas sp.]